MDRIKTFLLQSDDGDHYRLEAPEEYDLDENDRFITLTRDEWLEFLTAQNIIRKYQAKFREAANA